MLRFLLSLLLLVLILRAESIDRYFVSITLDVEGSLQVAEEIDYNFSGHSRHGIFRDIPISVSGLFGLRDIGLEAFGVSRNGRPEPFKMQRVHGDAGPMVRLKIGSASGLVRGVQRYRITYRVRHGLLGMDDGRDAVRWNAVGTGWKVPIRNIEVRLRLPSPLVREAVATMTFAGPYGSALGNGEMQRMAGDLYVTRYPSLAPHEGLTVEAAFATGVIEGNSDFGEGFWSWLKQTWHWPFFLIFTLGLYRYWSLHGRDPFIGSAAPMYEPPKGIGALEAGMLIDQMADDKDIGAGIVELASRGCLRVDREAGDSAVAAIPVIGEKVAALAEGSGKIVLTKEKDDSGLPLPLKLLHEMLLFPRSGRFVLSKRSDERARRFRDGLEKINDGLYRWSVEEGYMQSNPKKARSRFLGGALAVWLPFAGLALFQAAAYVGFAALMPLLIIAFFAASGLAMIFLRNGWRTRIFGTIFLLFTLGGTVSVIGEGAFGGGMAGSLFPFFLALLPILFFTRHMGVYTSKGVRMARYLLGYKMFMTRVKKDEIRRHLKRDPAYLERGLAYAVIFGMAGHWIDFYGQLGIATPAWFHGDRHDFGRLDTDLTHFGASAQAGVSRSGGISGGGSFSGGGGGGGGGGSW